MATVCPHCDSANTYYERGEYGQQLSPASCYDCGAHQFYDDEDAFDALDVEILAGWHIDPGPDNLSDADRARCSRLYPLTDRQKTECALRRSRACSKREERLLEVARAKGQADALRRAQEDRERVQRGYLENALF